MILRKVQALIEGGAIQELDFILVVVKASEARWSRWQYIHSQVEEFLGRDAKDRFVLMCTFSDGGEPECLEVSAITGEVAGILQVQQQRAICRSNPR